MDEDVAADEVEMEPDWLVPGAEALDPISPVSQVSSDISGGPFFPGHAYGDPVSEPSTAWVDALEALLPVPLKEPAHDDMAVDEGAGDGAGESRLLSIPSELLACIASFLEPSQLSALRETCSTLCRALDSRMTHLHLTTALVPFNSSHYRSLSPPWLSHVTQLKLSESPPEPRAWYTLPPQGTSPVCLWLLLFGPQLCNLMAVHLQNLPYLLEAAMVLHHTCPHITSLQVLKPLHQDLCMDAFWSTLTKFPNLKGWLLSLADLKGIETLTQLTHLHIKRSTNYPTGLRCLSALTNLRSITLEEIEYPGTIPQEFCGLSRLTKLDTVRFVTVGPLADEIEALCPLSQLKHLEISQHHDEQLIPALCILMSSITSLQILTLPQFDLSDGLIKYMRQQSHLRRLTVGRYRLTAACMQESARARQSQHSASGPFHSFSAGPSGQDSSTGLSLPAALMPRVQRLALRCPLPHTSFEQQMLEPHEALPALPLASVFPGLEQLVLLPSLAQPAVNTAVVVDGAADVERATEMLRLPLSALTALTTCAPLLASRALVASCPRLKSLVLQSCTFQSAGDSATPADAAAGVFFVAQHGLGAFGVGQELVAAAAAGAAGMHQQPQVPGVAGGMLAWHLGMGDVPVNELAHQQLQLQHQQAAEVPAAAAAAEEGGALALGVAASASLPSEVSMADHGTMLSPSGSVQVPGPPWLSQLPLFLELEQLDLQFQQSLDLLDAQRLAVSLPASLRQLKLTPCPSCPRLGRVCLAALAQGLPHLRDLEVWRATDVTPEVIVRLLTCCVRLNRLSLVDCAPAADRHCTLIMQRFMAAGRKDLQVLCNAVRMESDTATSSEAHGLDGWVNAADVPEWGL